MLDSAKRILLKIDHEAAGQVATLQTQLLQQPESPGIAMAKYLPAREDVVLDFVGRRGLLADLHRWFADPLGRRWLLAGTDGGRGKSAIAYEFAEQIYRHRPKDFALVAWLSAKERQYHGGRIVTLEPDFTDLESAIDRLLFAYGMKLVGSLQSRRDGLLEQLNDLPALIIVDDIDTLSGQGEQAIEFFALDTAATKSKVLFTARRVPLGLGAAVTHVGPFPDDEAREFVESRIQLYQIDRDRLSNDAIAQILELTDRSALYIDDLLLLCRNLSPNDAMRGWAKNRGAKVREYALKREVDLLTPLSRKFLIACGLSATPISLGELEVVANVTRDEAVDALTELGTFYLVPQPRLIEDQPRYSLNTNTKRLIQEVYGRSTEGRAIQAALDHVFGSGGTPEDEQEAISISRHAVVLVSGDRVNEATNLLNTALSERFPNHPRILGQLAWVYKKWNPPRLDEARRSYERAYQMNNRIPETYWHWAEMEGQIRDWQAQLSAAQKGLERCGDVPRLLVMAANAVNRIAYGLHHLHPERAEKEHDHALDLFERALEATKRIRTDRDTLSRIYAGLTRVTRVRGRQSLRAQYLHSWALAVPGDPWLERERDRG